MLARTAHQHRAHGGQSASTARQTFARSRCIGLGRRVLPALVRDHDLEHAVRGRLETEAREIAS